MSEETMCPKCREIAARVCHDEADRAFAEAELAGVRSGKDVIVPAEPIKKVQFILNDIESFDGDRRGMYECLTEAKIAAVEQAVIAMLAASEKEKS